MNICRCIKEYNGTLMFPSARELVTNIRYLMVPSARELKTLFYLFRKNFRGPEDLERKFKSWDANGDGKITLEELRVSLIINIEHNFHLEKYITYKYCTYSTVHHKKVKK